jgi:hypothetical protein
MMAKHFPKEKEIRIYSINDIGSEKGTQAMLSSNYRILKSNSMRVEKMTKFPFDYSENHFVKIFINDKISVNGKKEREFVVKSRYCTFCQ